MLLNMYTSLRAHAMPPTHVSSRAMLMFREVVVCGVSRLLVKCLPPDVVAFDLVWCVCTCPSCKHIAPAHCFHKRTSPLRFETNTKIYTHCVRDVWFANQCSSSACQAPLVVLMAALGLPRYRVLWGSMLKPG